MTDLPDIVQALLQPRLYPEHPPKVELAQTQMSFILLADDYVYKVKKPVNLGYLDYSTLDKRRTCCEREVELNRRLCPQVYLGVVPITLDKSGVCLGGGGEVVEFAVKMRRLPPDRMMEVLLPQDRVTPGMMTAVARKLADFHHRAGTGPAVAAFGSIPAIRRNTDENFSQTERYIGDTITAERYRSIQSWTDSFLRDAAGLFEKRVSAGRIRDCHGDLHAAHVCFTDDICIYDCIEFNDRFRYCDVASEIAFLAMDIDRYGKQPLADHFVKAYVEASADDELLKLLAFYKCYRAYVRGKVEGFKLDDPYIAAAEKARVRGVAQRYFELAESYLPGGGQ